MDNTKLFGEIEDILKVPDLGRSLRHKVEELKSIMGQNIGRHIRESGEPDRPWFNNTEGGTVFELHRVGEHLWIPVVAEGADNPDFRVNEVVPPPVVDYILEHGDQQGMAVMRADVRLPELKDRAFDLVFEKRNPMTIYGIINQRAVGEPGLTRPDFNVENIDMQTLDDTDKKKLIDLFLYYIYSNDVYYQHVLSEFLYRWKPMMDNSRLTMAVAT